MKTRIDLSDLGLWNEKYLPLLNAEGEDYDMNVLWGSGGSGKSRFIVQRILAKMLDKNRKRRRYTVLRKVAATLNQSVFQEFQDAIYNWDLERFFKCTKNPMRVIGPNGNTVVFIGADKREKMKSLAETQEIFIEEITEFELLDLLQIMIRVRGIGLDGDRKLIWAAFNPVDEEHWVKKTLIEVEATTDLAEFKIRNLHSTYLDNKFVGKNYVANLNKVRQLDPNYYRIYGLGEWGSIKPDAPFFYKFDYEKNINQHRKRYGHEVRYNKELPIYLSFDFNKKNSCVVSQKDWDRRYFTYLEEINEPVGFDLRDVVQRITQTYGTTYYFITGDPSGNGESAFTKNNQAAYSLIRGYFQEFGLAMYANFDAVTKTPLQYLPSKTISNAIFLEEDEVYFHPAMNKTIKDLTQMKQAKGGKLDKDHCEKNNYGHLGDCVRYDQAFHFYKVWSKYGYQLKNILG